MAHLLEIGLQTVSDNIFLMQTNSYHFVYPRHLVDPYFRRLIEDSRAILNKECKNIIESQRGNLKTGWPVVGIDPLGPINIERLELPLGT